MIKKLNESQLCDLITKATKQVLKESFGLDPEVGEDEYQMAQDHFNSPDGEGMPVDNLGGDEEFYDDFFDNPAEESFPNEGGFGYDDGSVGGFGYDDGSVGGFGDDDDDDGAGDGAMGYDELLESKNKVDMEEKQDKLLTFITENWDNHANSLIK